MVWRADQDDGREVAILSGLESALVRIPALPYLPTSISLVRQVPFAVKRKHPFWENESDKSDGVWGTAPPIMTMISSFWVCAETGLPAFGSRAPGAGAGDCRSGNSFPVPETGPDGWRSRRDRSART